jgi:hypothetical protein
MAKRRPMWEHLYDRIRVVRSLDSVCVPPAADAELDATEGRLGSPLPHSYREFLKRFGPGEFQGWVRLNRIDAERERAYDSVLGMTAKIREFLQHTGGLRNPEWLSSLVYFASSGGGDWYSWDPAAVTSPRPREYRFYCTPHEYEDQPEAVADSFWEFVRWAATDVGSWRTPDEVEDEPTGLQFTPAYLRAKKAPLKRDVKRWLAWNGGTVLALARSIRGGGQTATLPILADALEEAGCTNADMLVACRRGTPEVDGEWVIQVLLGKE